jgi:hypothetical protein
MKTPASTSWIPGLILVMASLPVLFAQSDAGQRAQPVVRPAPDFPAITTDKDSPALPLPEPGGGVVKRQPPKLRLSPWANEVVKLAESGVEAHVILAFIENSGTFNLGADQIIYLNDLGLSGEIVNAMLQHDRELITGAKPLTITSEPQWQLPFDAVFASERKASGKPLPPQSPAPKRPAPAADAAGVLALETNQEMDRSVPTTTRSAELVKATPAKRGVFDWQAEISDRKKNPYPVREPYPVELTAPIVFIHGEGRIPNTLVVLGFPRSTP